MYSSTESAFCRDMRVDFVVFGYSILTMGHTSALYCRIQLCFHGIDWRVLRSFFQEDYDDYDVCILQSKKWNLDSSCFANLAPIYNGAFWRARIWCVSCIWMSFYGDLAGKRVYWIPPVGTWFMDSRLVSTSSCLWLTNAIDNGFYYTPGVVELIGVVAWLCWCLSLLRVPS